LVRPITLFCFRKKAPRYDIPVTEIRSPAYKVVQIQQSLANRGEVTFLKNTVFGNMAVGKTKASWEIGVWGTAASVKTYQRLSSLFLH
jgi:hypothetical protein